MIWLVLGVALWSGVHLIPSLGLSLKAGLIQKLGENGYKGVFSVMIITAIILIVVGWRATDPVTLYDPPNWAGSSTALLMFNAFVLFVAANHPTRLKRVIRHPQLTGILLWSIAHLIANGDSRSLILFGGLGLWSLIEIRMINSREGAWVKPDAPSILIEIRGLAIGIVVFMAALFLHPYFAGVAPFAT